MPPLPKRSQIFSHALHLLLSRVPSLAARLLAPSSPAAVPLNRLARLRTRTRHPHAGAVGGRHEGAEGGASSG
eukprot:591716-Rhodomonas_salina.1